jgi:hypothetical protein
MDFPFHCKRCGHASKRLGDLKKHFNRKVMCQAIISDVLVADLYNETFDIKDETKTFRCGFCEKGFKHHSNQLEHQRICKQKPSKNVQCLQNEITKLKDDVKHLKSLVSNKIVNNITNNIQHNNITIHLNNFGNEKIEHMAHNFIKDCLKEKDMVRLLEHIHFDPEHPENHTIRIKNVNQNLMEYHEEGRWVIGKKDKVLEDMINCIGYRVLRTFYRKNKQDINEEIQEEEGGFLEGEKVISEIKSWLDKIEKDDAKIFRNIKNDITVVILNNKAMLCAK